MGNGTCTSNLTVIEMLTDVARAVKEHYGVSLRFVEILGKRWSCIAGIENDELSFLPMARIEINARYGIISEQWYDIPAGERAAIMVRVRCIVESYGQG